MFVSEATNFYSYYFELLTPEMLKGYEAGDEEKKDIIELQRNGTGRVAEFQKSLTSYNDSIRKQVQNNFTDYSAKQTQSQWAFLIFLAFMLLILIAIMRTMLKKFGGPLHELAIATEEISTGREVEIPQYGQRKDEVGMLSRSFEKMIRSIQENEQNLLAQNEELIAQHDELQAQQEELIAQNDELEHAVDLIQANEATLQRRNDLLNCLSNSFDKQVVLKGIVENICRIKKADRGIIALIDSNNEYAAFGLAATEEKQFIDNLHSGMITRLQETKKAFPITRNCTSMEKGYHTEELLCYELYVPVLSAANQVTAVMAFTRFSHPFNTQEMNEYEGISKQISISLDKIRLFEETEFDRLLNQDILNTIHEGLQLVDENGVIIQVNSKMNKLYTADSSMDMVNLPLEKWSDRARQTFEEGEALTEFMKTVMAGKAIPETKHIFHITAPVKRVIQVYFEELYRGNKKFGTLFVHRDITKAYEVDQMKSEFVSTVSHEAANTAGKRSRIYRINVKQRIKTAASAEILANDLPRSKTVDCLNQ